MAQLIAVDAEALLVLVLELRALKDEVRAARIQPDPKWLTINDYAEHVDRSVATVNRWISAGKVECKTFGQTRMVRL
ncbi:hypothetical protein [Ruegeria sp. HKCCD8929]|uniref:hypothetical protein n=1 Tax=Ruegeria sp. HKCCD8929 TaxID=2683006 RepID=UPI00148833A2|nr:hypothetical protein [Ruegeria sp. HKCCD8929]